MDAPITDAVRRDFRLQAPAREAAIALLRDLSGELALLGVTELYLFGSVARGDDTDDSDLDVAVRTVDPFDIGIDFRARDLLVAHLARPVDVATIPLPERLASTVGDDLVRVV